MYVCIRRILLFPQLVFKLAAKKILNYDEKKSGKKLRDCYKAFMDGFISFPLYIPGTAFYACIQVITSVTTCKLDYNHK